MYKIDFKITNKKKNFFLFVVFIIYSAFSFWFLQFHEMWRDELQAWLISRDSSSILDLLNNLKYEGHPGLWHFILYILNKFFSNPETMQMVHVMISSLSIVTLLVWSPFTFTQKILLVFSYFLFFEYNFIARNYSIGVLLIFLACVFFPSRHRNSIKLSFILFLLSHSSVFGLIFVITFIISIFYEEFINRHTVKIKKNISFQNMIAILIALFGIITSLNQIIPPEDSTFARGWRFYVDLETFKIAGNSLIKSYIPIPNLEFSFWNKSIFITDNSLRNTNLILLLFPVLLITFFLVVIVSYLSSKNSSLLFFLLSTFALLLFFVIKYEGGTRHHGFLFISLLASLWIHKSCCDNNFFLLNKITNKFSMNFRNNFIIFILSAHVLASFISIYKDFKYPFSGAKETAQYIIKNNLTSKKLVGYQDYAALAVAGYLKNKDIYYLQGNRYGTFIKFNRKRKMISTIEKEILSNKKNKDEVVYVLNQPIKSKYLFEIFRSKASIVFSENFYLYKYVD